ncbi:peptidoglycan editing factor PgeF [Tepidamorphus sp. 3E244]|uniref:peptidoglycan editing factor PgeF n=1 Tax=Tepidamorphus sp. 3E244 TaxID=3385498 RepID=UPI0038FCBB28
MTSSAPKPIHDDALSATGARHGFFTREGGVSEGIYRGLNCGNGSEDARGNVSENRARVASALGVDPANLLTLFQVHSADVVRVTEPWTDGPPRADAIVTATPGMALGVLTADCGPLLFADGTGAIVGCAHAGWKGAFSGIPEATVSQMEKLGARRDSIVAVLGPTISRNAYEVGPEFVERFIEADGANRDFFAPSQRDGHAMFDLPAYIARRMESANIAAFHDLGQCTYEDEERFFSYRRTTHRGEADYGRLIAAITPA